MADKAPVIKFKIVDLKTKGTDTIVSVEFTRDGLTWHRPFLIPDYSGPITMERFKFFLAKKNIEPTTSEKERIGELQSNLNVEHELPPQTVDNG